MKISNLKRIASLLMILGLLGIFVTSCEKETIQKDAVKLESLVEDGLGIQNSKQIQSLNENKRIRCSNFEVLVNAALNNLAQIINDYGNNPTSFNRSRVISQFDYYRLYVLEPCLPAKVVVPPFVYTGVETNCTFSPGFCSNGSAAISSLKWFQCHLNNFLTNPNDFGNQNDVSNAFDYYTSTLNICFGTNLNQSLNV